MSVYRGSTLSRKSREHWTIRGGALDNGALDGTVSSSAFGQEPMPRRRPASRRNKQKKTKKAEQKEGRKNKRKENKATNKRKARTKEQLGRVKDQDRGQNRWGPRCSRISFIFIRPGSQHEQPRRPVARRPLQARGLACLAESAPQRRKKKDRRREAKPKEEKEDTEK